MFNMCCCFCCVCLCVCVCLCLSVSVCVCLCLCFSASLLLSFSLLISSSPSPSRPDLPDHRDCTEQLVDMNCTHGRPLNWEVPHRPPRADRSRHVPLPPRASPRRSAARSPLASGQGAARGGGGQEGGQPGGEAQDVTYGAAPPAHAPPHAGTLCTHPVHAPRTLWPRHSRRLLGYLGDPTPHTSTPNLLACAPAHASLRLCVQVVKNFFRGKTPPKTR